MPTSPSAPPNPADLPVIVIGAGPVGLAAAVHLAARGLEPLVLEAGSGVGAAVRQWSHVRMFSPWSFDIDPLAAEILDRHGWIAPDPNAYPTGADLVHEYLEPLAATPELAPRLRFGARVTAVTREHRDRMKDHDRELTPFLVRYLDQEGEEQEQLARAVVDASGTYLSPNPLGSSGIPARGERGAAAHITYAIPNIRTTERSRYAGKRVLVAGSGHSAFNVLADLVALRELEPSTTIHWAVRRPTIAKVFGGGEKDQLAERGRLGRRIAELIEGGNIELHLGVHADRVETRAGGVVVWDRDRALPEVDEIVATTGFRPDLSILDEVRLSLDPGTQSPHTLGPMIDPNIHSCGTVRPHGAFELAHPEPNFYVVGMKSYGRAPTFLLRTGYEQVRSVAAALAGDWEAARRVELVLPETGACGGSGSKPGAKHPPGASCDTPAAALTAH